MSNMTHRETPPSLYRHRKRPSWGLAVSAWNRGDKRAYQFEDGNMRIFKRGFFRLLEEVDPPADRSREVLERLGRAAARTELFSRKNVELIPIEEQISYFGELYAGGFAGEAWTTEMRGGGKRVLKRHRDAVITRAREELAAPRLDAMIDAARYDAVVDALLDVLAQTNLVSAAKLKPLRRAGMAERTRIAIALRRLLHGDEGLPGRFDEFVRAIGEPSWDLATAPLALFDPEHHVCVKTSVFNQQAIWMAPRLKRSSKPTANLYQRYLKMACDVAKRLEASGFAARDLLDVHDFIFVTLRPKAREELVERRSASNASKPVTTSASTPTAKPDADSSGEEAREAA